MRSMIARLTLGLLAAAIAAISPANAGTYTTVFSFGGSPDGALPAAGLLSLGPTLYGTTVFGGMNGDGTVFKVSTGGAESIVYSFAGSDGYQPSAALINIAGTLYGTTGFGGTHCAPQGCGTLFSVNAITSAVTSLYSFGSSGDGANPFASVVNVGGVLYGTTQFGGANGKGTVFSYDPGTSTETVVYSFSGGSDGAEPISGLTKKGGLLYGTTLQGGTSSDGTVFVLDPSTGTESVLYSFAGGSDGVHPFAGLINVGGTLYGTTNGGGGTGCGGSGCGIVFSVDPSTGAETIVHTFGSGDGANPQASLLNVSGTLYGTTIAGGLGSGTGSPGYGTIYSIDLSTGTETVLHTFDASGISSDGRHPRTTLIDVSGTLYGTTEAGGTGSSGTVFGYTP